MTCTPMVVIALEISELWNIKYSYVQLNIIYFIIDNYVTRFEKSGLPHTSNSDYELKGL